LKDKQEGKMKRNIILVFFIVFVSFCLLYAFQEQQKLQKPLEYEVTVELVIVEVFVTDKKGNFVDNLTKDDFEIYEDGNKVEIQYFALVKPEKEIREEKAIAEIEEREEPRRPEEMKLVILFDNLNTNRWYLHSHWPQIQEMFKALSGNVEETMIMELNRRSGARIIQPFTSDQNLLSDVFSRFKVDMWKDFAKEVLKDQREELLKEAQRSVQDRIIPNPEFIMRALGEEEKYFRRERLSDSFSAFLAAVNQIRRFEGIKSVLLVSDGFPVGGRGDIVKIFDPFRLFGGKRYFDQREAFDKFLKLINEEKLIFYAFSPDTKSDFSKERWSRELFSLEKIAEETGGVYLRGAKKYENFVEVLGRDLTHFYDISYTPPETTRKSGHHRIEVRVKKPGLLVRFKKGYSDFTEEEQERKNDASAFLSPSFFKDIAFFCQTDVVSFGGQHPQFWIRLQIPLDQFREDQAVSPPEKLAMMFGINEWEERKVHFGEIEIQIKDSLERGAHSLYHAFTTSGIKLKPGEYETRVILKHPEERIGGWEASIKIPDTKKEIPLSIISSILGFLRDEVIEDKAPFSLSKKNGSLALSKHRLYPAAENVFNKREKVALYLQAYCPKQAQDFSPEFNLSKDEEVTLKLPAEKVESFFDGKSKILNEVYLLDFQDILPGDYKLEIKSSEKHKKKEIELKIVS
jgi:VWFA-related protein